MKDKRFGAEGFTLVEIMIVVSVIGLLAGISIPSFLKARTVANANTCINQLRQIEAATQEWALEFKRGEQQEVGYTDLKPYLKGKIVCPSGGESFLDSYSTTIVAEKPKAAAWDAAGRRWFMVNPRAIEAGFRARQLLRA